MREWCSLGNENLQLKYHVLLCTWTCFKESLSKLHSLPGYHWVSSKPVLHCQEVAKAAAQANWQPPCWFNRRIHALFFQGVPTTSIYDFLSQDLSQGFSVVFPTALLRKGSPSSSKARKSATGVTDALEEGSPFSSAAAPSSAPSSSVQFPAFPKVWTLINWIASTKDRLSDICSKLVI